MKLADAFILGSMEQEKSRFRDRRDEKGMLFFGFKIADYLQRRNIPLRELTDVMKEAGDILEESRAEINSMNDAEKELYFRKVLYIARRTGLDK